MHTKGNLKSTYWPLLAISLLCFCIYLVYSISYIGSTPYPGYEFSYESNLEALRVGSSKIDELTVDDLILAVNGTPVGDNADGFELFGYQGLQPGDQYTISIQGQSESIELTMPAITFSDRFERALSGATFLVFWVAGTAVLIFLQPRDNVWVLLVLFFYLVALFLVIGGVSSWRIIGSIQILRYLIILIAPIIVHLHWLVPSNISPKVGKTLLRAFYLGAFLALLIEASPARIATLPPILFTLGIGTAFLTLGFRYFGRQTTAADLISTRLMILGILLSLGPGIIFSIGPTLTGGSLQSIVIAQLSLFATPLLPLFYIYAIYKRQLAGLEFRTNRLLSGYSFTLVYGIVLVAVIWLEHQIIERIEAKNIALALTTAAFVLASPVISRHSQRFINRLAYGSQHNPDEIITLFANRIPSIFRRDALFELLTSQIMPALLIRQSALYVFDDAGVELVYAEGIEANIDELIASYRSKLLAHTNQYIPTRVDDDSPFSWLRLAIPLILRNDIIGIWLFGRRDPDDFYPQDDIDLLYTLANQIAPVIENIDLYEELQHQRDTLADQVQERTAELRTERDRTQAILDNAGEGIFFADPAGTILYANLALATITGFEASILLGQQLNNWATDAESAQLLQPLLQAVDQGEGWSGELLVQQPDGKQVDVSISTAPIRDEHGRTSGFVGVVSDISQAKEIDRLKTNIISNVSHELKTPLTNIRLYLELLNKGREKRLPEYISILSREAERLNRLIMDLLTASQLEMGTMPLELIPTDIVDLVDESLRHCAPAAAKKSITLNNDLPLDSPSCPGRCLPAGTCPDQPHRQCGQLYA